MFSLDIQRRKVEGREPTAFDKTGRRRHPADQALHRHDLRHGQGRLSGHLHDAAGGQEVLRVALGQDRARTTGCRPRPSGNMPAGPARRRPIRSATTRTSWTTTPGTTTTATRPITRSARRSPIPGDCTTCTATWREWCVDQYVAGRLSRSRRQGRGESAGVPTKVEPRSVRGGSWDDDPVALRSAARPWFEQGMEAARSADSAEHLVLYGRLVPGLSRRAAAGRAVGRREGQVLGRMPRSNRSTKVTAARRRVGYTRLFLFATDNRPALF